MYLSPHPDVLLNLFYFVDDLVLFIQQRHPQLKGLILPGPDPNLTPSEIITLSIYRYAMKSGNWKSYWQFILGYHKSEFPSLPDYSTFLKAQKRYVTLIGLVLNLLLAMNRRHYMGGREKIMFGDSSELPVCGIKREFSHKVCKAHAMKSKSTKGWFYGFKIHIVCDTSGDLLSVKVTAGNVDDRKMVLSLLKDLVGLLICDAGYLSEKLRIKLQKRDVHFFTGVRANMKKLMTASQHQLLKRRQRVESVLSVIKSRLGLVTSLPRSVLGYQLHYLLTCLAYCVGRMMMYRLTETGFLLPIV
jgi:hypothetical protein